MVELTAGELRLRSSYRAPSLAVQIISPTPAVQRIRPASLNTRLVAPKALGNRFKRVGKDPPPRAAKLGSTRAAQLGKELAARRRRSDRPSLARFRVCVALPEG